MTILRLLLFARVLYSCVDKLRENWTGWSAAAFNTEIDLLLGVYVVDKILNLETSRCHLGDAS